MKQQEQVRRAGRWALIAAGAGALLSVLVAAGGNPSHAQHEAITATAEDKGTPATQGREAPVATSAAHTSTPQVVEIYPTAEHIPANLLKLHIHLSARVGDRQLPARVHLEDDSGARIEDAFLTPVNELWDPSRRRLTVLLNPARVKTGLAAHNVLGRALVEGQRVRLVVEAGWRDVTGREAQERFERSYTIMPEDRAAPRIVDWSLAAPKAHTRDALALTLSEPLDQACLAAFVRVVDGAGRVVPGDIRVAQHETAWRFVPRRPWQQSDYRLLVDERLEDLAGNNLAEVFEHAAGTSAQGGRAAQQAIAFSPLRAKAALR